MDIDECVDLPDACVPNSVCVNTVVSSHHLHTDEHHCAVILGTFHCIVGLVGSGFCYQLRLRLLL